MNVTHSGVTACALLLLTFLVLSSSQQLLGPSNISYGTTDNFFIGSDGFTWCRACEIDCYALDVFSTCQYRYYRYGCYIQAYCVGSDTAEYMDRYAATAFCMIYNKCTPRTLSISYVSNQLAKRSPRPSIWAQPNIDIMKNPAVGARQSYLNANRRNYGTYYGSSFLRVRASLVQNFFKQQQVRDFVRFKVIQDLKDLYQKYQANSATFTAKLTEYWNNYGSIPMWFAQQAMLPLPLSASETRTLLQQTFIPEDYLFDSLNFVADQVTVAYLNGTSNFCLYDDPKTTRASQLVDLNCKATVNSPDQVVTHYFNRFPHMLGKYSTYGEFSQFQKRIFDYKYVRTFSPSMTLGPTYHGITGTYATIRAPAGWKIIAMNYANDGKGLTGVYPLSATEWRISADRFNDGTFVRPVLLFDPYNVYEIKVFSITQDGKTITDPTRVTVANGYTAVGGGFRMESAINCNYQPVSNVYMHTSYPIENGWAASFTSQSNLNCLFIRQTAYVLGLRRLNAPSAAIDHFFPPIFSRIEEPKVFNDRAGCSIMGQGTAGEFPFTELITSGAESIKFNNGQVDKTAMVTTAYIQRDPYASLGYAFNIFTNSRGAQQATYSYGDYKTHSIVGLTIFSAPPPSVSSSSSSTECDRRFATVVEEFRTIARNKGANLNNGDLYLNGPLSNFWNEYSRIRPSRSSFAATASICNSATCVTKTCYEEACYFYY